MLEQWHGEIWYADLKIDDEATDWVVYETDGKSSFGLWYIQQRAALLNCQPRRIANRHL